jgi:hypothetical protein
MRVSRLAFGVWRLAWKTDGVKSEKANGRYGDTVPTAFEDEDDDEYEDDGFARGLA